MVVLASEQQEAQQAALPAQEPPPPASSQEPSVDELSVCISAAAGLQALGLMAMLTSKVGNQACRI